MTEQNHRDLVEGLIGRHGPSADAVAKPVEIELRSGEKFIVADPLRGLRRQPIQHVVQDRLTEDDVYVGGILVEWGFDVIRGWEPAFHRWLLDNELDLYTSRPSDGVRYRGTYSVHTSTDRQGGAYRTIWAFDGFENFDDFGAALADQYPTDAPVSVFGELVREFFSFWYHDPSARRSQQILVIAAASNPTAQYGGFGGIEPKA